jgi:mRNA-degrading endonuclease toxin of MazEF toxin-antitoxin module
VSGDPAGDVYWIELEEPVGSGLGYPHPHVVVQNNLFNSSRINTVVVCALTSNLRRGDAPGNVLPEEGEGGLSKRSVVLVFSTVHGRQGADGGVDRRIAQPANTPNRGGGEVGVGAA